MGAALTELWQEISLSHAAGAGGGNLQLRATGAGELFLDHFVVNATKEGKACTVCDSTC